MPPTVSLEIHLWGCDMYCPKTCCWRHVVRNNLEYYPKVGMRLDYSLANAEPPSRASCQCCTALKAQCWPDAGSWTGDLTPTPCVTRWTELVNCWTIFLQYILNKTKQNKTRGGSYGMSRDGVVGLYLGMIPIWLWDNMCAGCVTFLFLFHGQYIRRSRYYVHTSS